MPSSKKNVLGRGLNTLIPMDDMPLSGGSSMSEIELTKINVNPNQPRKMFDEEALAEMSESIKNFGVIQPLSLRKLDDDTYQIIAGERRYRAAKMAGLERVPAYIIDASEKDVTEMALIENIQRQDLNPIEIALSYQKLINQYDLTQEELGERIGKKRSTIANFLRLLNLHGKIQLGLQNGEIDFGHARTLLAIEDPSLQLKLYNRIIKEGLSVRKIEEIVRGIREREESKTLKERKANPNADYNILQRHLSSTFKTNVKLKLDSQGSGQITFSFKDEDDLGRLISMFDSMGNGKAE